MPFCSQTQIFTEDGRCEHCPDYMRPVDSGYKCARPECDEGYQVQMDGHCKLDRCEPGFIKGLGGMECERCPLYTRPDDESQTHCISDQCTEYQYLRVDGTCSYCGAFM